MSIVERQELSILIKEARILASSYSERGLFELAKKYEKRARRLMLQYVAQKNQEKFYREHETALYKIRMV